ncbi:hypothetical protein NL53_10255 [Vibrio variabilis]|uniref:Uncharacterized protein n=3 Tax=Vibrio TaxID=662 RepID=A0A0A5HZ81_PHOS4|nr:hypothetical protein NM06_06925 [Vibrio sinaloensis]KHA60448.1 hypothetical protein NL53_10255 [Vibrio variabilis]KHD24836.1 hypothetical protein NM09_11815 [Vibrio caribbeanicus]KHT52785.1 hypothetical protein RJ46_00515 [Vibrio sinaloensis]
MVLWADTNIGVNKKKQRKLVASVRKQVRRPVNLGNALLTTINQTGVIQNSSIKNGKILIFFFQRFSCLKNALVGPMRKNVMLTAC